MRTKKPEEPEDMERRAADLVGALRKVIALEKEKGYGDSAAVGGMSGFAQRWRERVKVAGLAGRLARLLTEVAVELARYGQLGLRDRKRLLAEIEEALAEPQERRKRPPRHSEEGLETPVQFVKGIGPQRADTLRKTGVETVRHLLCYLPRRHEDRTRLAKVWELRSGDRACVWVTVAGRGSVEPRRRVTIVRVPAADETGEVCLIWFNQPYMVGRFAEGDAVVATGKVRKFGMQVDLHVEDYEVVQGERDPLQVGRIVPVYPLTQGLSQSVLRRAVHNALEHYSAEAEEVVPDEVRERHALMPVREAFREAHFPSDMDRAAEARRRLAFEELLSWQMVFRLAARASQRERSGPVIAQAEAHMRDFAETLPFALTGSQETALAEIARDLTAGTAMNRLLHGEVGSGKTVLAAAAAYAAAREGFSTALMSPTEVLASQHYGVFSKLLTGAGVPVHLLIGSLSASEKRSVRAALKESEAQVVVGTHALIEDEVVFSGLGLAVIDEQHRFGVAQRAALRGKGANCHVLVMSATPIPRTLMLTVYGDLEVSTLRELPPGRQPVETKISTRAEAYSFLRSQVAEGKQGYVVCPLIGDDGGEEESEFTAVLETKERLERSYLAGTRLAILHGRMSSDEQNAVVDQFRRGELDVLVCTTVIEVGLDVPNALVVVVEDAERFGLAQLHQLRGRVRRSAQRAFCYLLPRSRKGESLERLRIIEATNDGFRIAEEDLRLRGPGEFFGLRQHGLPDLRVADVVRDADLLLAARDEAGRLLEADPQLRRPEHRALARLVRLYSAAKPVAKGVD